MRVKHDYLLRDMGDQRLVIPVGEETRSFRGFVRLNDTGAYLWGLLEQDMTREDLAQALTRRWGVDEARVIWRGLLCEGWACDEAGKEHAPDARVRRLAPVSRASDAATIRRIVRVGGRDFRSVWWMVAAAPGVRVTGGDAAGAGKGMPPRDPSPRPTLSYPAFELRRGEALALTGRSGCGKSTLIKLLMGVYEPSSGTRVLVTDDGAERAYGPARRGLFAYVPQDDVLISGTVRDLPHGLDTMLGERGAGLSGGQAQRLVITRAVCSRHPVIVLDEATSALVAQTEAELLRNLRTLGDRTLLMVTHRLATMAACDRRVDLGGQE